MKETAFHAIQRMAAFLFNDYSGGTFRSGPLSLLTLHRDGTPCGASFQCTPVDQSGIYMGVRAWYDVDKAERPRHDNLNIQRTTIHELGHYWDFKSGGRLSSGLLAATGGRYAPQAPGEQNDADAGKFCDSARDNPRCYFPGVLSETPTSPFNQGEDWAEAVAFRAAWDVHSGQSRPGFNQSWRWHYVKCAADRWAVSQQAVDSAVQCAWKYYAPDPHTPGPR